MLNNVLNLVLQLIVILFNVLKTFLFISLDIIVDLKNPSDLLLLGCDDSPQDFEIVIVVGLQIGLPLSIGLPLLAKLVIIVTRQLLDSLPVTVVIILELIPQAAVVVDEPSHLSLTFLPGPLQLVIALLNLMLLLFNLIVEPLDLGLMKILELVLVLPMLPDQIILDVFVLSFDQINLMCFLLL